MFILTLPEVGATGPTGGDDGAGGYMPLAIVKGGASDINWVHSHHNAKPILLTNSTGTVVAYSGHAVLGFPGQFANAVGLAGAQYYYNRYRDYNDATGRYIQADPIGLAGDANPYAYAMGNTLRYSDPTGELAWLIPIAVGFAGGLVFDAALEQYKKMHCTCKNGASNGTPLGAAGNAALGTAAGGLARAVPKPRGGIAGGGNSGAWTSSASTLNHRWSRLGAYSPTTRRAITAGLRRGGKMVPYLGAAIAAYQIHDAVSCK
jgi:RHS repeat-associated protein